MEVVEVRQMEMEVEVVEVGDDYDVALKNESVVK